MSVQVLGVLSYSEISVVLIEYVVELSYLLIVFIFAIVSKAKNVHMCCTLLLLTCVLLWSTL